MKKIVRRYRVVLVSALTTGGVLGGTHCPVCRTATVVSQFRACQSTQADARRYVGHFIVDSVQLAPLVRDDAVHVKFTT